MYLKNKRTQKKQIRLIRLTQFLLQKL